MMAKLNLSILIATILCASLFAQGEEMKNAAQTALNGWQKSFTEEQAKKLGFADLAGFKAATLGIPLKIFTIEPDKILSYTGEEKLSDMISETAYYAFPVVSGGKNTALLWVYQKEGKWTAARLGSAGLTKALHSVEGTIQEKTAEMGLEGAEPPKFIRIYQLFLDFYYLHTAETEYIVPFQAVQTLRTESGKFFTPAELLPAWKEVLQRKMEVPEKGDQKIEG